jgi:trimethylamine--corrinoid protein Co-methyltransferase
LKGKSNMVRQINEQTVSMRPHMKFCSPAQLYKLHNAALHILERTGLVIHCSEAIDLLGEIGCWLDKGQRVRIPSHIVDQALARAPKRISVYNRQGDPAMLLEGLNSYYGPGPTIQYVYDAYSRERRASDKEDIQRAAAVCDYLPNIDFAMTMGMTGGVYPKSKGINPALTDRLDFAAMLGYTQKPLIFSAWSREGLADIWDMAVAVRGSEAQACRQPLMILFTQPISPLVIDTEPVRQLFFCAEKGIPAIFSSAPTMGSTAPNSIAGSVAQALAEFFGALVLSQFKNPGAHGLPQGQFALQWPRILCEQDHQQGVGRLLRPAGLELRRMYRRQASGRPGHGGSGPVPLCGHQRGQQFGP